MPSFKLHGYSRSNVPEMSVTFENGVTDRMVLEPYRNGPCNFIGKLKSHQGSTAVTGCLNKPGDKMHITLLSELNTKSAAYEMDFDGHLKAIENPFQYQKGKFTFQKCSFPCLLPRHISMSKYINKCPTHNMIYFT